MAKKARRGASAVIDPDVEVPVVGPRQPCPCGSGKRYKLCHGRAAAVAHVELVERPFEQMRGERDWVAMREIVPAATATARTRTEYGGHDVLVATVLPMAWAALHRGDGQMMLGLQNPTGSGDPSRDAAASLLTVLDGPPGTAVAGTGSQSAGPRLQDVLDPDPAFTVRVHESFEYWLGDDVEQTEEIRASMERANESIVPTERLVSVDAAYWCRIGERTHLRWVLDQPEDEFLDALARLHADGASSLGENTRYLGAFRAHGLVVPVWDLAPDAVADDVEEPAAAFAERLAQASAVTDDLTPQQRRARSGLTSRQLTLR